MLFHTDNLGGSEKFIQQFTQMELLVSILV